MKFNVKKTALVFLVLVSGYITYKYSPYKVEFAGYYDKIWAHRVNSLDKLNYSLPFFKGVELDLVYNEKTTRFDVRHPPAGSFGLTFERYLSEIPEGNYPGLWLDIKNLNKNNAPLVLEKINFILNKKKYPRKAILIETQHPEALPLFSKAGFNTSYYIKSWLYQSSKKRLEKELDTISEIINAQPRLGISTHYKNYGIIDIAFRKKKKYIWILNHSVVKDFSLLRKILKDTTVKVVLTGYKSIKGNR